MSIANILFKMAEASLPVQAKTVTATLTADEMKAGAINAVHAATPVALTLPAANTCAGVMQMIYDGGAAAATVIAAAGFGGTGAGGAADTLTLAQGEAVLVWSDGSYWYALHNEPAG